jgi:DNA-binding NtrC family response regulator
LNERREDIPLLAEHFLSMILEEQNMPAKTFTKEALNELQHLDWTGNIRELRNVVERLVILSDSQITGEDVTAFAKPKRNE